MRSPEGNHELRQLAGRPDAIWERGDKWVKLGIVMKSTAEELGDIGDSSVHKSKGTEKLGEEAAESENDLRDAGVRYKMTGKVLRTYAEKLEAAKTWLDTHMTSVENAENAYQNALDAKADAVSKQESLDNQLPWEDEPSQSEKTAAADAVTSASGTLTTAKKTRDDLWTEFDQVFETWEEAYEEAVDGIQKAMDTADNNDGFWEFVDSALDVIAVVLIVLSVIALIIGAPLTGLLGLIILGLTLLTIGLTLLQFAFGKATLSDVAWSLVGLLPFGIGKMLSKGAPVLSAIVRNGRGTVTAVIRAGIPRPQLLRPLTWLRGPMVPIRWLAAPFRARAALPSPSTFVNPFRSIAMGGPEGVQVQNFLNRMRSSPWSSAPQVQQFISQTTGALPGRGTQALNSFLWGTFTTSDVAGVADLQPDIPVLEDIQVPWGR